MCIYYMYTYIFMHFSLLFLYVCMYVSVCIVWFFVIIFSSILFSSITYALFLNFYSVYTLYNNNNYIFFWCEMFFCLLWKYKYYLLYFEQTKKYIFCGRFKSSAFQNCCCSSCLLLWLMYSFLSVNIVVTLFCNNLFM